MAMGDRERGGETRLQERLKGRLCKIAGSEWTAEARIGTDAHQHVALIHACARHMSAWPINPDSHMHAGTHARIPQ